MWLGVRKDKKVEKKFKFKLVIEFFCIWYKKLLEKEGILSIVVYGYNFWIKYVYYKFREWDFDFKVGW